MSSINLAQALDLEVLLAQKKAKSKAEPEAIETPVEDRAKQVPTPTGYRILCAVPEVEKKYESGIAKADESMRIEELLTTVLFVVDLGPECYMDKTKFPSGPWCAKGDFVLVRPNAGTRIVIHGREFRLINDDSVEGTVQDPRGIKRKS